MKVVIDTSVWVSALIKKESGAREILRLVFQKKLLPQISEALFKEYESVMTRKKIRMMTVLTAAEQNELFEAYLSQCRWVDVYYSWRPNLIDENDNFLIELAIAGGANIILTYNLKDFENAELVFDIKITTPEKFLKEMP